MLHNNLPVSCLGDQNAFFLLEIPAVKHLLVENINLQIGKCERGTPPNRCSGESKHRAMNLSFCKPTPLPAMRQMLLLKQHVLPAMLSSPGAYLCLNWAMGESWGPLTKAVELIYSLWHLADEPPSPAPISPDIHSPSLLPLEWHILVPWAIPVPVPDLPWTQEEWHTSGVPSSPLLKGLSLRSLLWTINFSVLP